MPPLRYYRAERLKSRKRLAHLFAARQSVAAYPLRLLWQAADSAADAEKAFGFLRREGEREKTPLRVQAAFSVPKKRFPRAVDRNRIKRLMRESYRLHKTALLAAAALAGRNLELVFLFAGDAVPASRADIDGKCRYLLRRLQQQLFPATTEE